MKNVVLNNGVQMPILGFGVFQVAPEQTEAVKWLSQMKYNTQQ